MKTFYKITIPEPCHENWDNMSLGEKGRFCSSCAKTVVDFTQMSNKQVQDYLLSHQNVSTCGRLKTSQLYSITIEIPQEVFHKTYSFRRTFLLVLLLVMGTTLFSCETHTTGELKIENIQIVNTINRDSIALLKTEVGKVQMDSSCTTKQKPITTETSYTTGLFIVEESKLPPAPDTIPIINLDEEEVDSLKYKMGEIIASPKLKDTLQQTKSKDKP